MRKTIYISLDTIYGGYDISTTNFWTTEEERRTGLFVGEYASRQLVAIQEIEFEEFDPHKVTEVKIASLETKLKKDLADSYVRQHNLQDQINELKCLTHQPDSTEPWNENVTPKFNHIDDDIPY